MVKKIKNIILSLMSLTLFSMPVLVPAVAHAQNAIKTDVCTGADAATGATDDATKACNGSDSDDVLNRFIKPIINILSVLVGAVSVIMLIVGGFKYITSGGDSGKVGSAKNTIIYALIGLALVALSQVMVRFVLSKIA